MQMQLEQTQKLNVSQKMIQSAMILQMNQMELEHYLEDLSMENPMMEFLAPKQEEPEPKEESRSYDEQNRIYERQERSDKMDPWNSSGATSGTLAEELFFQVSGMTLDPMQHHIVRYMIHCLDSKGYLNVSLVDISKACGCEEADAQSALLLIQKLEPYGVGARNLQECLLIQLQQLHPEDTTAARIVQDKLELLIKNQIPVLAKQLHKPLEEVLRACQTVKDLNPFPGTSFSDGSGDSYICPELIVSKCGNSLEISINTRQQQHIHFNSDYVRMLTDEEHQEVISYLKKKKEQLEWVKQCIAQRDQTLQDLGELILQHQRPFFLHGSGNLKAFSQSEAASLLGVHESTVSRAVKGKYLQCQFGIFPLSYFFPQGLEKKDRICQQIRMLIDGENKHQPLSDQALSEQISQTGTSISKRMVTKYRNELHIPEAALRRVYTI